MLFEHISGQKYLEEQSVPRIIRNSFEIYGMYFREIFLTYFLLMYPFMIAQAIVSIFDERLVPLFYLLVLLPYGVASMVLTILVSRVCVGESAGIISSFKHISVKSFGKLIITTFIFIVVLSAWFVGSVMLISVLIRLEIPGWMWPPLIILILFVGVVLWILLFFYPPVVILEKRWGFNAFKRSVKLGYGHYHRVFAAWLLMFLPVVVISYLLMFMPILFLTAVFGAPGGSVVGLIVGSIAYYLPLPLSFIYVVLLYYDLRVRKEDYDTEALKQELRH